jgi:hypothetical protein
MAAIEGGAFRCDVHVDKKGKGFTTTSIEEWNAHCTKAIDPPHREEGQDFCPGCGELVTFSLPFKPLAADGSKGIGPIVCNDCESKNPKDIKIVKVKEEKKK